MVENTFNGGNWLRFTKKHKENLYTYFGQLRLNRAKYVKGEIFFVFICEM